jgi:phospholipase A1/A2
LRGIRFIQTLCALALGSLASGAYAENDLNQCLMQKLGTSTDATTVGELRAACASMPAEVKAKETPPLPVLTQRREEERQTYTNQYAITPHRPNYLLLASYAEHRPSNASFARDDKDDDAAQKAEAKFQISLKAPLWLDAFGGAGDFFVGYTQRSFWQTYNTGASAPFRETDYEPEVWFRRTINQPFLGWNVSAVSLGFNHQSNGRGHDFSHSWNRIIGTVALERESTGLIIRPWWRIPESKAHDDNPDMTKYMGRFDITMIKKYGSQSFELMVRNNLHTRDNKGALQVGWSFPLTDRLRGYVQWFTGYGESLIDYNVRQNTIGAGIQLVDW